MITEIFRSVFGYKKVESLNNGPTFIRVFR